MFGGKRISRFDRTKLLLGEAAFTKLQSACVCVIGLGGVGGACVESLCRSGIGTLIIVDHDVIDITNINRQIIATTQTVGQQKVVAWDSRLRSINPDCSIIALNAFYNEESKEQIFARNPHFVVDAIDTVSSKLHLAVECKEREIPLIACMGTGNRFDPSQFKVGTIEETAGSGCGLSRVMRQELKRRGIHELPVVYSSEFPQKVVSEQKHGRNSPASISFCPPVAGYLMASYVIMQLIKEVSK